MHFANGSVIYSPSDLITFIESEYASWMDRLYLEQPGFALADGVDDQGRMIMAAGVEHEKHVLEMLAAEDSITHISSGPDRGAATQRAMANGAPIIYQAYLEHGEFMGLADFLIRTEGASYLGDYHYEVWDAKLGQSMKPHYAVQLCCYAEILASVQGHLATHMGIFLANGERRRLRVRDFYYYYRVLKAGFCEFQEAIAGGEPPDPADYREYGRWTSHAERLLKEADHPSFVANIRFSQIRRLGLAGIHTVKELVASKGTLVAGLAVAAHQRLCDQAELQLASAGSAIPMYRVLPHDREGIGLSLLPPVSSADVCFDIEGYPLIQGGLEYLLGVTHLESGQLCFSDWWAHDRDQEKQSFREFIGWIFSKRQQDPAMHVYHYAPYETSALKRLAARHGCCEAEVDELLRARVFVDLYAVVRQGLLVGEPAYSLKNIEHIYMPKRAGEVATAGDSMVYYHNWRQKPDGDSWKTSPTLRLIRDYNEADCDSTWKLLEWLRSVQRDAGIAYTVPGVQTTSAALSHRSQMASAMLDEVPQVTGVDAERWRVHQLLANVLEFHRREDKPIWWALFDRSASTDAELEEDPDCLANLERTGSPPVRVRQSFLYEYQFNPKQETRLREGGECYFSHDLEMKVEIEHLDFERGLLTFPLRKNRPAPPQRLNLIPDEIVPAITIVDAIERLVRSYRETGSIPQALEDFLYRRGPRLIGRNAGPVMPDGDDQLQGAIDAALSLDHSTLCIQGPPGCGKTHTAAHMIAALLGMGKRIGIMSNGHRAVGLLLAQSVKVAQAAGVRFTAAKVGGEQETGSDVVQRCGTGGDLFKLDVVPDLVGGTAWVFAHAKAAGVFDYLFVDEAGQVSVANLVGVAASAQNLILLGDQMQLDQPTQGTHPGESGESILQYLLQNKPTIPNDLGIFLSRTWRMRPEICEFISDAIYDGRLAAEPVTSDRELRLDTEHRSRVAADAGVVYAPVEHDGNQCESEEEVEAIGDILRDLARAQIVERGIARPFRNDDVLIVSPYNLQVRRLRQRFPGFRVGTVDKFQGQEAPVVIVSMAASSADAAPRGIEFLFSKNRLNVAISRAQILAMVVASPKLARAKCARLEQIELVNLFCRVVLMDQRTAAVTHGEGELVGAGTA
jgi:predicted RecB family nuclease